MVSDYQPLAPNVIGLAMYKRKHAKIIHLQGLAFYRELKAIGWEFW